MMSQHPLRDLSQKIYEVCKGHKAYGQAKVPITNFLDHLQLMASYYESQHREEELQRKLDEANESLRMLMGPEK